MNLRIDSKFATLATTLTSIALLLVGFPAPAHSNTRMITSGSLTVRFQPERGISVEHEGYPLLKDGDIVLRRRGGGNIFFRLSESAAPDESIPSDATSMRIRSAAGSSASISCDVSIVAGTSVRFDVAAKQTLLEDVVAQQVLGGLSANIVKGMRYRMLSGQGTTMGVLPLAPPIFVTRRKQFKEEFQSITIESRLGDLDFQCAGDATAFKMHDGEWDSVGRAEFMLETWRAALPPSKVVSWSVNFTITPQKRLVRLPSRAAAELSQDTKHILHISDVRIPQEEDPILIPQPQLYRPLRDDFLLNAQTKIVVASSSGENRTEVIALRSELHTIWGLHLAVTNIEDQSSLSNCIVIGEPSKNERLKTLCRQDNADPNLIVPQQEGYIVLVRPTYAIAVGFERRGTFYATMTLLQLLKRRVSGDVALHGVLIQDYPDLVFRGVHLHADNYALEWGTWLIERVFSRFKINYIVLECEYAQWDSHPEIGQSWGMTKDDMRKLRAKALEYGIEIIPMVRLLGHCEWMFANGRNRELAEDPSTLYTYCPSEPKSYEFIFDILQEVIEVFQPRYLHVGHDELGNRGIFPRDHRCAGQSAASLFLADVNRLSRFLSDRNVRMMMWGDMLLNPDEVHDAAHGGPPMRISDSRASIPRNIIINDWHYSPARDYPSVRLFQSLGHEVIVASWFNPLNIYYLARCAAAAGATGLLQTTWTGHNGNRFALERSAQQIAAYLLAAEYSWSASGPSLGDLRYDPIEVLHEALFPHPHREGSGAGFFVDLSRWTNISLSDQNAGGWLNYGRLMDLQRFPYGDHRLGDIRYRIAGTPIGAEGILLRGRFTTDETPDHIDIPVHAHSRELRFLHTCAFAAPQGEEVGGYEIILEDGSSYRLPLIYGENIRSWDDPYASTSRHAVWKSATLSGTSIAIKHLAWDNPKPEVSVAMIRLYAMPTDASPVLLAISGLDSGKGRR